MTADKNQIKFTKTSRNIYRSTVAVAGFGLLLWSSFFSPVATFEPAFGLIIFIFVAFQVNFPIRLPLDEIYLFHILTLGAGLLFGAPTALWGATAGVVAGYALRRIGSLQAHFWPAPNHASWLEASFVIGRHHIALMAGLFVTGFQAGLVGQALPITLDNAATLLPALVLFSAVYLSLTQIDFLFRERASRRATRQNFYSIVLFELIAWPFILLSVTGYSVMNIGTLLILGGIPAIIALLIFNMERAQMRLQRRVSELSMLNQVSQALQATLDLEELLNLIHLHVSKLLDVDNFYVALYDPAQESLWYPLAVKHGQRQNWAPRPMMDRLTDRVIRERKPLLLSQHSSPQMQASELPPSEETPHAWIGVPLIASERAIGCLALFSLDPETDFVASDLDLLVILSGQISVAIENAMLYEQTQRRAGQLETLNQLSTQIAASLKPQEVLDQVCQAVNQVAGGDRSAIFLLESQEGHLALGHAHGLSDRFIARNHNFSIADMERARCLRTGQPVLAPTLDANHQAGSFTASLSQEGIQAHADFPLITPEGMIGFLSVYYDHRHNFSQEEVELLQTFASQAALAVANARLHTRTDMALSKRVHQLSILESIGRELAAATHSQSLFEIVLDYAREFTNSPWGNIGLLDPITRRIEIKASRGYRVPLATFPADQGVVGQVLQTGQPALVNDLDQSSEPLDLTQGAACAQLSVPLIHEERILGVLTLESPEREHYSSDDQGFIAQVANQAAIAVINAELYRETQQHLQEQSTLYQISRQFAGQLELKQVLDTLKDGVYDLLNEAAIGIYLFDENRRAYQLSAERKNAIAAELGNFTSPGPSSSQDELRHFPEAIDIGDIDALSTQRDLFSPVRIPASEARYILMAECDSCQVWVVPLVAGLQRLGMVCIHLPESAEQESEHKMQALQSMANQGAISLQNALLFADISHGRDQLEAVINSVSEGILMIDAQGRVLLVNKSSEALTGLSAPDLIERNLSELSPQTLQFLGYTEKDIYSLLASMELRKAQPGPAATFQIGNGKSERFLERYSLPVWGEGGKAIGWLIVLRDITQQRQIEEDRELITETLIHDLRSPLSAVLGALDVIEESETTGIGAQELIGQALSVARRAARRVLAMVESLLDIARMESGDMEIDLQDTDLKLVVEGVVSELLPQANDYGIILRFEFSSDLPQVRADRAKIARVVSNILDNAIKFTPSGGQVVVSCHATTGDMLALEISDSGPGIPQEFREKIFEPFSQVPELRGRRRGSGLGLTFCKLAVEAHGGRIWVQESPGGGSLFTFTLPISQE